MSLLFAFGGGKFSSADWLRNRDNDRIRGAEIDPISG
jgi:hypothetical protein